MNKIIKIPSLVSRSKIAKFADLETSNWYSQLVEDCQSIITETIFNSRWALIEGYKELGDRILKDLDKEPITKLVQRVGVSLGKGRSTIWYAVQFAKTYPDINKLPDGKNSSWHKICNNLLSAPKEEIILPKGKYSVVLADPPWPYPEHLDPKNLYGSANYHYERMSIKDICSMKITDLLPENAVLFIWVATNFLEESFEVIKLWGFDYKSQMAWVKNGGQGGIGYYFWGDHELLLVATKGSFLPEKVFSSVYSSPREKHSKKPDEIYKIIEAMYPNQSYLELFARQKRKGWTSFGDQLDGNN